MAQIRRLQTWIGAALAWASVFVAQAAGISQVSPQGSVHEVRQVVVQTTEDAVRLGNAQAAAPVQVQCSPAQQGTGRWNNAREWVWQLAQPLPAGTRCQIALDPAFRLPSGATLSGGRKYQFEVAGPTVLDIWPPTYEAIDESQSFVLQLNGPATAQSLAEHVYCRASDVGERIPVTVLDAAQTAALRDALDLEDRGSYVALSCQRRMTAGAGMELVYGAGVAMASGVHNRYPQTFAYSVRPAFTAELRCQREQAHAGCLPIRELELQFSAPVSTALARQVRLVHAGKPQAPMPLDQDAETVQSLRFAPPFAPKASYHVELPEGLQDDAGRNLANARAFPLPVRMGDMPPLVKFAASPFGVLERFVEGSDGAVLPLTVRQVADIDGYPAATAAGAQVRDLHLRTDADILHWWNRVQRYDNSSVAREEAVRELRSEVPPPVDEDTYWVETRALSLLQGQPGVEVLQLPPALAAKASPLEVVGIPLQAPGFHVVEVESPRLGVALLDARLGSPRSMFVRTSALVTNLAVHLKLGREGSAVWVTSLDHGKPVAGAKVQVSGCDGVMVASGRTNAQGLLALPQLGKDAPQCRNHVGSGAWFVSARHSDNGVEDMAFVWSDWQRGIEPWRFNVPTTWSAAPELVAHTVLDRNLVRAGETVGMKHVVRQQTLQGLALPADWPVEMLITHMGSGQSFQQKLQWVDTHNGGRNAISSFDVPVAAKLGAYSIELRWPAHATYGERVLQSGEFRVEAFRLPVFTGDVQPVPAAPLVQPRALPVAVDLRFINGGAAQGQTVQVSALLREKSVDFERWAGYRFQAPRQPETADRESDNSRDGARLVADKLALTLDAEGQGQLTLPGLPAITEPQTLVLEASFADPNGEIQTLRSMQAVWPAAVLVGLRTEGWMTAGQRMKLQAVAVDTQGRPQAGVPVQVQAVHHTTTTTRKRIVGGFYTYDNQRSSKDLGTVCQGRSDARGLLLCEVQVLEAGEVELIASAQDAQARSARAAETVWVSGQGELWFGGQDHDRMDVLAEQTSYAPGETAKLQVRMPFREATALVSVEREGVLYTEVVQLEGQDPTFALPVQTGWGPNVFVSVLALRGRLYEVPWYSFFTWGYQAPRQWWKAYWHGGKEYVAPSAMVDLSKPAFRLGVVELQIHDPAQQLHVQVQTEQRNYQIREKARVTIRASLPDGKPAAFAEVAVAAVDQALLELSPNTSWNLRQALWQRRGWSVDTATAQMEVVGRRHYGRKAAAPGGGGGRGAPTRELLDTLLLWSPRVQLDAQGQAQLEVPLNDALTQFVIVAVAEDGVQRFGTGQTEIQTRQDLQVISGLPPVVREGDQFSAMVTVRNSTDQSMQVLLHAQAPGLTLAAQTVELAAQQAREVTWQVTVPEMLGQAVSAPWAWRLDARDATNGAQDSLLLQQKVLAAVPLAVQQASIVQVEARWEQAMGRPEGALPERGGVRLRFSDKLADKDQGVPGLRDWWAAYPYSCLEQTVGKAIGMDDLPLWQRTMAQLPTYLDDDGLAMYFPPQGGARQPQGSDSLTAYLLQLNHSLKALAPQMQLPEADRVRMESALVAFVEGRLERRHWSPRPDLEVRKLAAVAALAVHGKASPSMLESIRWAPQTWPTHAVIDGLDIVRNMPQLPQRAERLEEVQQVLRNRLSYQGSQVVFSTDAQDQWWWLMQGTDMNAARLLLATMVLSDWDAERTRLVLGLLARQQRGSWGTTTANTWAGLALRSFSARYEHEPVSGHITAQLGTHRRTVDWGAEPAVALQAQEGHNSLPGGRAAAQTETAYSVFLPWGQRRLEQLSVQQQGTGNPWVGVQSLAAVPRTQPWNAGYVLRKTVSPLQGANDQHWLRGDLVRVRLEVDASADMSWVALDDPIPAGASILGSGLGRDAEIARTGEAQEEGVWPTFVERGQDSYRVYWDYLPQGKVAVEYTLRLNNAGDFALPPTRVEALYAPEMFGEWPNARWKVAAP